MARSSVAAALPGSQEKLDQIQRAVSENADSVIAESMLVS
jgi:hypothetical protein